MPGGGGGGTEAALPGAEEELPPPRRAYGTFLLADDEDDEESSLLGDSRERCLVACLGHTVVRASAVFIAGTWNCENEIQKGVSFNMYTAY